MLEKSVERVLHSRLFFGPPPITNDELQGVSRPMTDEKVHTDYQTKPDINMNEAPPSHQDKQKDFILRIC